MRKKQYLNTHNHRTINCGHRQGWCSVADTRQYQHGTRPHTKLLTTLSLQLNNTHTHGGSNQSSYSIIQENT
ncbi:hypothetical protein HanPSC8_Chr05g0229151 [Helianthus annuus]|nr:hypothetical protein HanPSC8_Chr05g0229151 [Helianthus annuus]